MSKFAGFLNARRGSDVVEVEEVPSVEVEATGAVLTKPVPVQPPSLPASSTPVTTAPGRGRGRPRAKRSDPDFEQVTAYIRRNTHRQIKIALLQESEESDFSELVEKLLSDWLRART